MCIARATDRCRTEDREPGSTTERGCRPSGPTAHRCTVPTGFSGVPPPGPAIPVTPIPTSAPKRDRAPSASAAATCVLTAPYVASISDGTPTSASLAELAYDATPPSTHAEDPARSVSRATSSPLVHDSAVATVSPRSANADATSSSTVDPVENSCAPWASRTTSTSRSYSDCAPGP